MPPQTNNGFVFVYLQEGFSAPLVCTPHDARSLLYSMKFSFFVIFIFTENGKRFHVSVSSTALVCCLVYFLQEFEESGDPEKHFQALLSLAKEGIEKGKVCTVVLITQQYSI